MIPHIGMATTPCYDSQTWTRRLLGQTWSVLIPSLSFMPFQNVPTVISRSGVHLDNGRAAAGGEPPRHS